MSSTDLLSNIDVEGEQREEGEVGGHRRVLRLQAGRTVSISFAKLTTFYDMTRVSVIS